jgi:hypothetical protein
MDTEAPGAVLPSAGGHFVRYRTRHLLYITAGVCAALAFPGSVYVAALIVGPWLVLGPLMLAQLLFILLIPPLRQRLFQRDAPRSSRPT